MKKNTEKESMNKKEWLVDIDEKILDDKKSQTTYKIKYIQEYVKLWILVSVNRAEIVNINFIDCMCNAGIYHDGDLCTSMEVLSLFITYSTKYPEKRFNLFLNDYDQQRVKSSKIISQKMLETENSPNLKIYFSNSDVNDYLLNYQGFSNSLKFNASTLNFVDPYNFGDVKLDALASFISRYYCEVAFNVFTSDYVRNKEDPRIRESLGKCNSYTNKEEFVDCVVSKLKIGKMKYVFPYIFKNSKNSEIYQIIFLTPNIRGLEKLKEALFKVFKGPDEYRNSPEQEGLFGDLFSEKEIEDIILQNCASDVQKEILKVFKSRKYTYQEIESYVIEKTVLQESHMIRYILTPLIKQGIIQKCNKYGSKNYKKDEYIFR